MRVYAIDSINQELARNSQVLDPFDRDTGDTVSYFSKVITIGSSYPSTVKLEVEVEMREYLSAEPVNSYIERFELARISVGDPVEAENQATITGTPFHFSYIAMIILLTIRKYRQP